MNKIIKTNIKTSELKIENIDKTIKMPEPIKIKYPQSKDDIKKLKIIRDIAGQS